MKHEKLINTYREGCPLESAPKDPMIVAELENERGLMDAALAVFAALKNLLNEGYISARKFKKLTSVSHEKEDGAKSYHLLENTTWKALCFELRISTLYFLNYVDREAWKRKVSIEYFEYYVGRTLSEEEIKNFSQE